MTDKQFVLDTVHKLPDDTPPSDLPIAGRDTATMFESSMINDDTSEAVNSTQNFEGALASP
jgi:hypothetical protein